MIIVDNLCIMQLNYASGLDGEAVHWAKVLFNVMKNVYLIFLTLKSKATKQNTCLDNSSIDVF